MVNYIAKLQEAASVITDAKAANNTKKTASNMASAVGFYALLNGKIRDAEEVKAAVSKEGSCKDAKAAVSKGTSLAKFFMEGGEIAVTTEEQGETVYNKESFNGSSIENLPAIAFSTLYTYVKKAEKQSDESNIIEHNAKMIMEETHNLPFNEIKALLGDEQFTAQWENALLQAGNAVEAEKAKENSIETVKAAINALSEDDKAVIQAWMNETETKQAIAA